MKRKNVKIIPAPISVVDSAAPPGIEKEQIEEAFCVQHENLHSDKGDVQNEGLRILTDHPTMFDNFAPINHEQPKTQFINLNPPIQKNFKI